MMAGTASRDVKDVIQSHAIVSFWLAGQQFGLPIGDVREVLSSRSVTRIPLASGAILGSFNLRGRIVTVVDMRRRLGMPPRESGADGVTVVVERGPEVFGLAVDCAGDVLALAAEDRERTPLAVDPRLRDFASNFYRHAGHSLVLLDIDRLLNHNHPNGD